MKKQTQKYVGIFALVLVVMFFLGLIIYLIIAKPEKYRRGSESTKEKEKYCKSCQVKPFEKFRRRF